MSVGILMALGLVSILALATSIFVAVRHFWRMEDEVNEAIARALAEESAESTDDQARADGAG